MAAQRTYDVNPATHCPKDGKPLTDHVGEQACIEYLQNPPAKRLSDLPIFGWAWREDGKDMGA